MKLARALHPGLVVFVALLGSRSGAAIRYEVTNLRPLGFNTVAALNNSGQIAGTSATGHLLFWNGTEVRDLGTVGAAVAVPTAMNNSGQIVGYLDPRDITHGRREAFLHTGEEFLTFGRLLSVEPSVAYAVNDEGILVGSYGLQGTGAFFRYGGTFSALEIRGVPFGTYGTVIPYTINLSRTIAGTFTESFMAFSERWKDQAFIGDLSGEHTYLGDFYTGIEPIYGMGRQASSVARDINDAGIVVGTATSDVGGLHESFFLYSAGRMVDLGGAVTPRMVPGWDTLKLNNEGVAVATAYFGDLSVQPGEGMLWSGGVALRLRDLVAPSAPWIDWPADINDRGQIVTAGGQLLTPTAVRSRLVNISARSPAGSADTTNITGFVLAGGAEGSVLVRTVGPTLSGLGVTNAATDSALTLISRSGQILGGNQNWSGAAVAAAATRLGAFSLPEGSRDAALLTELPAGSYSVHAAAEDPNRIILSEIYDAGSEADAHLANASVRLQVGTGESIGMMGFVVAGDGPCLLLIRAAGPSLSTQGVAHTLADPLLWLYRGSQPVVGNDNWGSAATTPLLAQKMQQVGAFAFPDGSRDAALLMQVEPGVYTVHVSGVGDTTGVALIELYVVP